MARNTLDCAANISDETLSGWRDFPPAPAEMTRIREHITTCPVCQQRLVEFDMMASALSRQREIEPGDRILAGVRRRATLASNRSHGLSWHVWGGLGALAAVSVLVLLFVYVFGGIASHTTNPLNGKTPIASHVASPSPTLAPATPTLAPAPPIATAVDVRIAWGSHAAATITTRIDALHRFEVGGVTPDGLNALGYQITLTSNGQVDENVPAQAGFMNIATRRFTSIGISDSPDYSFGCCIADGHFLLMEQDTAPGATCGQCHKVYWSYDMDTGQKYRVASGTDFQMVEDTYLSHGLLVMGTGDGVKVADLATHSIAAIPGLDASAQPVAFSWPYLLYKVTTNNGASSQTRIRDLSANQDIALPQINADDVVAGSVFLAGNALFLVAEQPLLPGTPASAPTPTTLYELDAFMNPDSLLKPIASYKDTLIVSSANARLVVFSGLAGLVWDRAERRFVLLGKPYDLSGIDLVTNTDGAAGLGSVPTTVSVYNTATLPVLTGS